MPDLSFLYGLNLSPCASHYSIFNNMIIYCFFPTQVGQRMLNKIFLFLSHCSGGASYLTVHYSKPSLGSSAGFITILSVFIPACVCESCPRCLAMSLCLCHRASSQAPKKTRNPQLAAGEIPRRNFCSFSVESSLL